MSRSYNVTLKKAQTAFYEGDTEPAYQASEKEDVKHSQKKARSQQINVTNRSIVSAEMARTNRIKRGRQTRAFQLFG